MIQQLNNRTTVVLALCAAIFFAGVPFNSTSAQSQNTTYPANLKVKYVGDNYGQPVYSIQFDNEDRQVHSFYISDAEGTELYSENVTGTSYSRKFQLNLPNLGNTKVVVTLVDGTGKGSSYQVNTKVTIVETAEVTRI
ncbi:MAG: hypothetical protein ACM3VS_13225 [Candidatus Dadabacteria bacterium]